MMARSIVAVNSDAIEKDARWVAEEDNEMTLVLIKSGPHAIFNWCAAGRYVSERGKLEFPASFR